MNSRLLFAGARATMAAMAAVLLAGCNNSPKPVGIITQPSVTQVSPGQTLSLTVDMTRSAPGLRTVWNSSGKGTFTDVRADKLVEQFHVPNAPGDAVVSAEVFQGADSMGIVSTTITVAAPTPAPNAGAGKELTQSAPTPSPTDPLEETPPPQQKTAFAPSGEIKDVPPAVNRLSQAIAQAQLGVVTPGGTQEAPMFSAKDLDAFEGKHELHGIENAFKKSTTFAQGVAALKKLPQGGPGMTQQQVLAKFRKPLYPTWKMNHHIDDHGTTEAGYAVEKEIADALTDAVNAALSHGQH